MVFAPVGSQAIAALGLWAVLSLVLPLTVAIVWCVKKKERFYTVVVGALIFVVFALGLESIPKAILLNPANGLGETILSNPWLTTIIAALLAGIFEETGRWVAYKWLLKKQTKRETAITYGIGHGGGEVIAIITLSAVNYLIYAFMINNGTYGTMVEQVRQVMPSAADTYVMLADTLANYSFATMLMSIWERCSSVLIHISCSILMFSAVREKGKGWLFPVSILLHGSIDVFAGLYQTGIITNAFALEALICAWAVVMFAVCLKVIYKKLPKE